MKSKYSLKRNSLLMRILVPVVCVMLVQAFLFIGTILWGGTVDQVKDNALSILDERVINRQNSLETDMVTRWSNLTDRADKISLTIDAYLTEKSMTPEALVTAFDQCVSDYKRYPQAIDMTARIASDVVDTLRRNVVNGAFVIFGGDNASPKSGLYIRDNSPLSVSSENTDLEIQYASQELIKVPNPYPDAAELLGPLSLASGWSDYFSFDDGADYGYFYGPYRAAVKYKDDYEKGKVKLQDLGQWGGRYYFSGLTAGVVTYSVPLIVRGTAVGVLGVDLSPTYLQENLPYREISNGEGAYALARQTGEDTFETVVASGPDYTYLFGQSEELVFSPYKKDGNPRTFAVSNITRVEAEALASVHFLTLYNSNTPFEQERWALVGIMQKPVLFAFASGVQRTVILASIISMAVGIVVVCLVSILVARPIMITTEKIRSTKAETIRLGRTNIYEIDALLDSIETLSENVADNAQKLSRVIEMAQIPMTAFEVDRIADTVDYTDRFFEIIGIPRRERMTRREFGDIMQEFERCYVGETSDNGRTYSFIDAAGDKRWVEMRVFEDGPRVLGILRDVTKETIDKTKIEYERDYDILTGLFNRRAFNARLAELFRRRESLGFGAMMMFDLDNLKTVNDTYGHDAGDEYIRTAGRALKVFGDHAVVGRMSGDEFLVFVYGYESEAAADARMDEITDRLKSTSLVLPDNTKLRLRCSGGIARYPRDAVRSDELVRYADFAMYEMKHSSKGEFKRFDPESYKTSSYLVERSEQLNNLIEHELVEYKFQPIVSVETGKVFGYEALMRSLESSLPTPQEVISLARSQSKLHLIERLTWFNVLKSAAGQADRFRGKKLFINSIPSQFISDEDVSFIEREYAKLLGSVVIEFTEDEKLDEEIIKRKKLLIRRWSAASAIDDFGTGYSGDTSLLILEPDFVKIDMFLIRNIDRDENKRNLVSHLISYCKEHKIKVIGEGVETAEELSAVIACGVDYIQGFYTGRPTLVPGDVPRRIAREIVEAYRKKSGGGVRRILHD